MVQVSCKKVSTANGSYSWAPLVHGIFGEADTKVRPESGFHGEISQSSFGSLHLSRVVSSNEAVNRTARHIALDQKSMHILVAVRRGSVVLRQNRRENLIRKGQFVLYDSDTPLQWEHAEPTEILNVCVPSFMLEARIRNLAGHFSRVYSGEAGTWKIAWSFLESITSQLRHISELAAYRYSQHLVDMVSLALEAGDDDLPVFSSAVRLPLYRRCAAYIRANLSDQDLNPAKVAKAMGISVRYLHRIFQDSDDSVCDFIRGARLDACRADVCDPSHASESIADIAFRFGFGSQSYFATAFKKRFGTSARELRRESFSASEAGRQRQRDAFDLQKRTQLLGHS